jgi:glutaminyl-peptide cyclotransferase
LRRLKKSLIFYPAFLTVLAISCCKGNTDTKSTAHESDRAADSKSQVVSVDGERALGYIKDIIAFGPRHAGTEGAEKTRLYIIDRLRSFGLDPKRDDFTALTPHPELKSVKMANIVVDIGGGQAKKVMIGGHFEGKILDGVDFKGANDGGSSTALLLEMARVLSESPPPCPVRIVFFDGEEALVDWSDTDSLYGSKHMAAELKSSGEADSIAAVVIVDMIGDKRLRLVQESFSNQWVFGVLSRTATRLGVDAVFKGGRGRIEDDHIPFLQIGIPAAVLIDLSFGPGWASNAFWHTKQDTVDKLSPRSIETIGKIVLSSLWELSGGQNK